jgi:hypothetical protein
MASPFAFARRDAILGGATEVVVGPTLLAAAAEGRPGAVVVPGGADEADHEPCSGCDERRLGGTRLRGAKVLRESGEGWGGFS